MTDEGPTLFDHTVTLRVHSYERLTRNTALFAIHGLYGHSQVAIDTVSVEVVRIKPTLPMLGERTDFGNVVSVMWNTEDPDEGGAYTAHLLVTLPDDPGHEYRVVSISWDDERQRWDLDDYTDYASIGFAARAWAQLTGDDAP